MSDSDHVITDGMDDIEEIHEALGYLAPKARRDYIAVRFGDVSVPERAEERDVSISTICSNIERAREGINDEVMGDASDPINNPYMPEALGVYLDEDQWLGVLRVLGAAADIQEYHEFDANADDIRNWQRIIQEQVRNRKEERLQEESRYFD